MKHDRLLRIFLVLSLLPALFSAPKGGAESMTGAREFLFWEDKWEMGASGSSVCYPVLRAEDHPQAVLLAEKINEAIQENARIPAYLQLLSTIQEGGTGLFMDYDMSCARARKAEAEEGWTAAPYASILFSARGKMLSGRPSQVYYPMTLNLNTGESVAFEELFSDPDGAKAFIEAYLEEEVEPSLSTYLENSQLFPVPYDRFFLDGYGNLILCYENSQLSFLSGDSGTVAFRYSELWDWLDTSLDGVPLSVLVMPEEYAGGMTMAEQMDQIRMDLYPLWGFDMEGELGMSAEALTDCYPQAADSEYYPGGACFEVETAFLRGTLILTDEAEDAVVGVLSKRADYFGICTGKTSIAEAEAMIDREPAARLPIGESAAELYRVCPGTALVYQWFDGSVFTLYADESGIVQYIKSALK